MFNLPVVASSHSESLCLQTEDTCKNSKRAEDVVMQLHTVLVTKKLEQRNSPRLLPILNRGNSTPPSLFWTSHLFELLVLPYKRYLIFQELIGAGCSRHTSNWHQSFRKLPGLSSHGDSVQTLHQLQTLRRLHKEI